MQAKSNHRRMPTRPPERAFVRQAPRAYAAERWARVVASVVDAPEDPRTLEAWARVAAAGRGTLRSWCRGAGVPAKASLDFARLLRAVVRSRDAAWDPQNTLDIVDERTLKRLCVRGGLVDLKRRAPAPTWESFVARQRLVSDELALRAITTLVPSTVAASRPRAR